MPEEVFAIMTRDHQFEPENYAVLAWQKPAWDDDGYFWTAVKWFRDILKNHPTHNAWPHKFAFETEDAAWRFIKNDKNLEQNACEVIKIKL